MATGSPFGPTDTSGVLSNNATDLALHKVASVDVPQGNRDILSRTSQSGLFFSDARSIKSASFNQKECAPAAYIRGLPYELIARRNKQAGLDNEGIEHD